MFEKYEFCEKQDFEIVNFVKNEILKMWIFKLCFKTSIFEFLYQKSYIWSLWGHDKCLEKKIGSCPILGVIMFHLASLKQVLININELHWWCLKIFKCPCFFFPFFSAPALDHMFQKGTKTEHKKPNSRLFFSVDFFSTIDLNRFRRTKGLLL